MMIIVGLILWGVSIDQRYHWMVGQVAMFLCKIFAGGCKKAKYLPSPHG
jgi:hypothetical protein